MAASHVLIVDDSEFFSKRVESVLEESHGFETTAVRSPDEALELARSPEDTDGLDCVVSNYEMPGMNGVELLGELRDAGFEAPFVLLTAKPLSSVAPEAIDAGVSYLASKQNDTERHKMLVNRIRKAVELHRCRS
ncbi:MAG: response regulator [Halobacteria archaeon]|nr:response regulator [Halobacteria archaeon]